MDVSKQTEESLEHLIPALNASSEDHDHMLHSVASDLGLHLLPMSILWNRRHTLVN